jgi:hypothetical protein
MRLRVKYQDRWLMVMVDSDSDGWLLLILVRMVL